MSVVTMCIELEFIKWTRLKIGHAGTLDEQATGVLAVGLGTGCSLLQHLLHSDQVCWNIIFPK